MPFERGFVSDAKLPLARAGCSYAAWASGGA